MTKFAAALILAACTQAHAQSLAVNRWHPVTAEGASIYVLPMVDGYTVQKGLLSGNGVVLTIYVVDSSVTATLTSAVIDPTTEAGKWDISPKVHVALAFADTVTFWLGMQHYIPQGVSTVDWHGQRLITSCRKGNTSEECRLVCKLTRLVDRVALSWHVFDQLQVFAALPLKSLYDTADSRDRRVIDRVCGPGV